MSRLTIVGYDDPYQAEEVRLKLLKLQREYVMALKGRGRGRQRRAGQG